jgi:glycosyltransferase involved in cell wall biosynthesis
MSKIFLKIIEAVGIKMEKFSIIIRNRNEEAWIGHCIQSIIENFEDPEIIIIDNNSTDKSIEIAKTFKKNKNFKDNKNKNYAEIKIFNIDDYTPGKSLNYGVLKSKNKNIMIISAHCVIDKIDIDATINNLKKYKAIFGKQDPVWRGKKISKRYIWSHFVNKKIENMFSNQENRFFFIMLQVFLKNQLLKKYHLMKSYQERKIGFGLKKLLSQILNIYMIQVLQFIITTHPMELLGRVCLDQNSCYNIS